MCIAELVGDLVLRIWKLIEDQKFSQCRQFYYALFDVSQPLLKTLLLLCLEISCYLVLYFTHQLDILPSVICEYNEGIVIGQFYYLTF